MEYDSLLKVVVVGDAGVGKSSLLRSWSGEPWQDGMKSTVGVDFIVDTLDVEGKVVKLQMWDTAGQEKFRALRSSYYRGTHCALVVFDLTVQSSFAGVKRWADEVAAAVPEETVFVLIGNKSDLPSARVVSTSDAEARATSLGFSHYFEVSARTSSNVSKAFEALAATTLLLQPIRSDIKKGYAQCSEGKSHVDNTISLNAPKKTSRLAKVRKRLSFCAK